MTPKATVKQTTMFDVPESKDGAYSVYHDESGDQSGRYLLHGALFVPDGNKTDFLNLLASWRNGFSGRLHFSTIRDHPQGSGNAIRNWLNGYVRVLAEKCRFKCIVVDTNSPTFDQSRFGQEHYKYNYFAMQTVYSGICWTLSYYNRLMLRICSERKSRSHEDNFVSYLPSEILKKTQQNKKCPIVAILPPKVLLIDPNPRTVSNEFSDDCEFTQLTDLLTSSVSEAIHAEATRPIKLDLARHVAGWVLDTRKPPWLQSKELHRRFSVSCFPSESGDFFDCSLAITNDDQPSLF